MTDRKMWRQVFDLLSRQMSSRGHALLRVHNEGMGACSDLKCTENCAVHRAVLAELAGLLGESGEPWTAPVKGRTKRDRRA